VLEIITSQGICGDNYQLKMANKLELCSKHLVRIVIRFLKMKAIYWQQVTSANSRHLQGPYGKLEGCGNVGGKM
jgi:hypothetical protein